MLTGNYKITKLNTDSHLHQFTLHDMKNAPT